MSYTAADSLLIQKTCDELGIDVFTSTYYTSAVTTPQVQMVYDMIPEVMEFDLSARAWKEKQLTLSYATFFACISANTRHDLLHFLSRNPAFSCGRHTLRRRWQCVQRTSGRRTSGFQGRVWHQRNLLSFLWDSREQNKGYKNASLFFDAIKIDKVCLLRRGLRRRRKRKPTRVGHATCQAGSASFGSICPMQNWPPPTQALSPLSTLRFTRVFGMPVVEAMARRMPGDHNAARLSQ